MVSHTDEQTPLLNRCREEQGTRHTRMESPNPKEKSSWRRYLNPMVTRKPKRFCEIGDLGFTPSFLKHRSQSLLTAQWTHRLHILQKASPADMAASLLARTLDDLPTPPNSNSKLSVVDFCSGGGGPTPTIERLVNEKRKSNGEEPIPFVLSDIHPNLDSWNRACSQSDNLSFIPQPVDATDPPVAVISQCSPAANNPDTAANEFRSDTRVFRLYNLAFHHFPDALARKVLRSTMESSDGFAIVELQDRRLASLILMVLDLFLVFIVSVLWFWWDPLMLVFTYIVPLMPFVMGFDGMVSSLRTRTFDEVLALMDDDDGDGTKTNASGISLETDGEGDAMQVARRGDWVFRSGREMHTWPLGYMNWIVGVKKPQRQY